VACSYRKQTYVACHEGRQPYHSTINWIMTCAHYE
jgi:hypothetical protein